MTRLTDSIPLEADVILPETMYDPELVLFKDGTPVVMVTKGQERAGVTIGRKAGTAKLHPRQVVRWDDDDAEDHVGPHMLFRARDLELVLATLEPWVFMTPETVWVSVAAAQEVEVSVETVGRILRALARQNKVRKHGAPDAPKYAPKIRV